MLIQLEPLLAKCDCCGNYYDSVDTEDHFSVQEAIEKMVADG
nr:MAG TPA: MqsA [Caudoviricetes sp.]